jgi:iron complex transport system permease protein
MAAETGLDDAPTNWREDWFGWVDRSLAAVCLGSLAVVVVSGLAQVSFGSYSMTIFDAWRAVFDPSVVFSLQAWEAFLLGGEFPEMSHRSLIVWNIRLPRVFVAVIVGMNLAVSGAIFQAVTRNELASPFILGVSSGAGLMILLVLVAFAGATIVIPWLAISAGLSVSVTTLTFGVSSMLPILAAVGGTVAFVIVYAIAWKNGTSPVRLVLAGVIVGTAFGSLQTALFFFADSLAIVQSAIQWTTGSLTGTDWEQVRMALPWTIVAMTLAIAGSRQMNVLLLGEKTADSLGMNVERVRFALSGVAVLAAATSIAVAGIVGFVGLIVPHMVRNVVGSDYRRLVVGCVFAGPALMVSADVGARLGMQVLTGSMGQMPVGIVTGLVGTPYFLYLMRKKEQMGEI